MQLRALLSRLLPSGTAGTPDAGPEAAVQDAASAFAAVLNGLFGSAGVRHAEGGNPAPEPLEEQIRAATGAPEPVDGLPAETPGAPQVDVQAMPVEMPRAQQIALPGTPLETPSPVPQGRLRGMAPRAPQPDARGELQGVLPVNGLPASPEEPPQVSGPDRPLVAAPGTQPVRPPEGSAAAARWNASLESPPGAVAPPEAGLPDPPAAEAPRGERQPSVPGVPPPAPPTKALRLEQAGPSGPEQAVEETSPARLRDAEPASAAPDADPQRQDDPASDQSPTPELPDAPSFADHAPADGEPAPFEPGAAGPDLQPDRPAAPEVPRPAAPSPRSAPPAPGARPDFAPAWLRAALLRSAPAFTSTEGWQVVELTLEDDAGTAVIRTRRDEERVTVAASISNPALRAQILDHVDQIQATLQSQYQADVAFTLDGGADGQDGRQQAAEPERRPGGPAAAGSPAHAAAPERHTRRPGTLHEWIG